MPQHVEHLRPGDLPLGLSLRGMHGIEKAPSIKRFANMLQQAIDFERRLYRCNSVTPSE
jgi:hypothetical protein